MKLRTMLRAAVSAAALVGFGYPLAALAAAPVAPVREVLPANAQPTQYAISIEPDLAAMTFKGSVRAEFTVREATADVVMNAADLTIRSAVLNTGAKPQVALDPKGETVRFHFDKPLAPGKYALTIAYDGKINETANGLFVGAYKGPDGQPRQMLVTQFEPGDARRLAPMWDEPSAKAVFVVDATIPAVQTAMSNMPIAKETPLEGGKKRVAFQPTVKMSSYLLFLGIGDLDRLTGASEGVELGIVSKAGDKDKGAYALEVTKEVLPFYNSYFGVPYPLPKLDQIAVPGAGGFGAMENWGAILYFEPVLLFDPKLSAEADKQRIFSVVAHEMAHQWFGDLVTMAWWDDLWLNEGFASWMETKAASKLRPDWNTTLQSLGDQEAAMGIDARSSTHPIVQPVANVAQALQAFDTITYQKGEAVIRMIESFLGEDAFRKGVQAYMQKHAYQNTVTSDLWSALEAASGTPVRAIAADFTTQGGVPLITVNSITCQNGKSLVALSQGRYGVDAESKQPRTWRTPVTAQTLGQSGVGRLVLEGKGALTLDGCGPVVVNKDRTGYFRVKYDDGAFNALRDSFAKLGTADQLALLYDAWALGTTADASSTRYLELVSRIPTEADPLVQRQVVGRLAQIHELYEDSKDVAAYDAYALSILKPMFAWVGWDAKAGEAANVSLLRSSLIGALGRFGDAEVLAEARRRFLAAATDPKALPPSLRSVVIGLYGYSADPGAWDTLVKKAADAKSPLEQRQYLSGLAAVKDPALARKSLDLFLTDATPKQLTPQLVAGVSGQHSDLAWTFYLAHREQIDSRLDPLQRLDYPPGLAASSSDPKRVQELKDFAAKNLPADADKSVKEALAAMANAQQVKANVLPAITSWVAARRKG